MLKKNWTRRDRVLFSFRSGLRRWFRPPASGIVLLLLAAVFGLWPAFDPNLLHKWPYLCFVAVLLVVGTLFSSNERWESDRRHAADLGARIMDVRLRVWEMAQRLDRIVRDYDDAVKSQAALPDLDHELGAANAQVHGVLGEIVHFGILMSANLMAALGSRPKTIDDMRTLLREVLQMSQRLTELYNKTTLELYGFMDSSD